ncbi:glycosyltransferase family 4 protein [Xanthomarina sp. F2636L]|uniref:glycosyltransferase family 4 protein n=1 Tax=Xanthomarina sp. F2636L TaxID=2996018 RepID=UPI00225E06DB|nr:glycosyltransferase family 4 protein [Xanthomarina sp. F2636L]MCX7549379.1 glycosyltransferase family 4 protein [Xanthomarina sp. F2636L]
MKILLFHTYNQGYLSSFFHEMAIRLNQEGHEVVTFSWKASVSEQKIDNIKIIIKKKQGYITNYLNVFKVIKKEKPDVILSNFSYVNPALLFGKLFHVQKNIVWFHSLNEQTGATPANIFTKHLFLKMADVIIANSHHTKNELHSVFQVLESKIKTIPFWSHIYNQEDKLKKTGNQSHLLKIGCPGRLVKHKNQIVVLEALAHFENKNFQLHIAGNGPDKENLQQQAKQLGIVNQILFRGHLSAKEMMQFYKDMDVVVLPSLAEAFGLVFIEAISMGTPVIVSSKFGALTFIDNKELLEEITFDPLSMESLIERLKPYFDTNDLPSSYFKNLYLENFDKDLIYERLKNIILND